MKPALYKILVLSFFLSIVLPTSAQKNEILFVNHQYQELIEKCSPPKSEHDYYWKAQALAQQGKLLQAIALLESTPLTHQNHDIKQLKADLYFQSGQYNNAMAYYVNNSRNDANFLKLSKILEFNGSYMIAIDSLRTRLKSDSLNIDLLHILANCYYRSDAPVMAIMTYLDLYKLNPNDLKCAYKLSILLLNTKMRHNVSLAVTIADSVLQKNPNNNTFLRIKGRGYYMMNNYNNALPCFKQLYDNGYTNLFVCKYLGICEFKMEQYNDALTHFNEALKIEPYDLQTNQFVGKNYLAQQQIKNALTSFSIVDSLLLPSKEMMNTLLWDKQLCYKKLQDFEQVDSLLHQISKYDNRADVYFYIAANYQNHLNKPQKALQYYELFLDKSSTSFELQKCVALRSIAQNRISKLKEDQFWQASDNK